MWQLRPVAADDVAAIAAALDLTETTARSLWLRGLHTPAAARAFLAGRDDLAAFHQPVDAPGMAAAVARIRAACEAREPICVYGDYDCDGVTSAVLLYRYLKHGPKADVRAYLPDRVADGYGLNPAAVRRLAGEGVKLIVTTDNGISANAAAEACRELGVDLVITDHHQLPETLPRAILVHPQLGFPAFSDLSGVGVALLLVVALEGGWSERLRPMLDLVALGTVADVVPLGGPNRALVWGGLAHLRAGVRLRPGFAALISGAGLDLRAGSLSARDLAFSVAPLVNAAGRLDRARLAFDLLATDDPHEARALVEELKALNQARRDLDRELATRLLADVERGCAHTQDGFLVLADRDFHPGVIGPVAGKLAERLRKPVLLLAEHEPGVWKGSARGPEGHSLHAAFTACRDLLVGFGGHAQAAGCSVAQERIADLRVALNAHLAAGAFAAPTADVVFDACPPLTAYSPRLLAELELLEPCGAGNPAPVLGLLAARVLSARTDRSGRHLFLKLDDGEGVAEAAAWGQGGEGEAPVWVDAHLRPVIRRYRGEDRLEFRLERFQPTEAPVEPPEPEDGPLFVDLRTAPDRLGALRRALAGVGGKPAPPGLVAVYTADRLPALGLDRALGDREVRYWTDRRFGGSAAVLVMWERPISRAAWERLAADVQGVVYLMWEPHQVEPEASPTWLAAFHRDLAMLVERPWPAVEAWAWSFGPLMREAGQALLVELGLLDIDGDTWRLAPWPGAVPLEGLAAWQAYLDARAFRLLLANGAKAEVLKALRHRERLGAPV
ncbi:MAG: recJ [Cyanobacteria bacterium RYN_339]|nr:recJ [Cyanobacteria bacterium RYN_339]